MEINLIRCGWLRILPLLCQLKKTSRTMKKIIVTMMALALTIGAQAQTETIDTSKFVVTYDYAVQTKMGKDDREIVDSCCVALMVGTRHTMQMEYYQYVCQCLGDRSVEIEMIRNSIHLYPTIYGNYPDGKMTTREFLAPRLYVIEEPMNAQQWTLTDDTLTVMGYACKTATCKYAGRSWTVCYTEDVPSTAGPWKLHGLPGLIVRATDNQGIHTFCLRSLEQKAVAKFIKERNKLRCNSRYAKDPTYYLSSKRGMVGISYNDGTSFLFWDEEDSTDANNFYDPMRSIPKAENVRYYQPLELE